MVNNINWVKLPIILDRLLRHPLLGDLNLETAIQYTLDFIGIMGLPNIYVDKIETIEIKEYRGTLPCDLISINQVRLHKNGMALGAMTDNFNAYPTHDHNGDCSRGEPSFKTQGRVIFTSIKEEKIDISYKAIMLDDEGLPLIPDNSIFLKALELYIKKEWFTILFDMGKISPAVLNNTQQEYAFKAGQCNNEFVIPSVSEMEAITNMWNQLIPGVTEFRRGFKNLGDKEYIRVH
jgi:hypothetical protein|nr:MAG TPA: hypothetical protein [Crassvirales sp.]